MTKRLKAPPRPSCKIIKGHPGRSVLETQLRSGGVGYIDTTISEKSLAAFAASLRREVARRRRLTRGSKAAQSIGQPDGDEAGGET